MACGRTLRTVHNTQNMNENDLTVQIEQQKVIIDGLANLIRKYGKYGITSNYEAEIKQVFAQSSADGHNKPVGAELCKTCAMKDNCEYIGRSQQ